MYVDQLPDLLRRQPWLPRRHAVRAPFGDRAEHLRVAVSVDPVDIAQARSHSAAGPSAVTARAIEFDEQLPAFAHGGAIVRKRVGDLMVQASVDQALDRPLSASAPARRSQPPVGGALDANRQERSRSDTDRNIRGGHTSGTLKAEDIHRVSRRRDFLMSFIAPTTPSAAYGSSAEISGNATAPIHPPMPE